MTALIFTALATAVALMTTPVYRASVVILIRQQSGTEGLGKSLLSQFGGLASIAGISSGSGSGDAEAYALLQSRQIAEKFISVNNLLPVVFNRDWDLSRNKWKKSLTEVPSSADGYKYFIKNVLKISQERKTSLVTLSMDWVDPALAANWANLFIRQSDEFMRNRAMDESRTTIVYLDQQIKIEQSVPIRESLFQLLEAQQKSLVFAKTRREFAYRVIDPAVAPQSRDMIWPKRRLTVLAGAFFGVLVGLIYIGIHVYRSTSRLRSQEVNAITP